MFKELNLYTRRSIQITMVFMLFVFVQNFFNIPHSIWIMMTGAMVYSGFHPGTVIKRAYLRLTGTIIGIAAVSLMWHVIHFDFRLVSFFFVGIIWACVFFLLMPYNKFMIFITLYSDILIELPNTENFYLQDYILDRFICTFIAFLMCIGIEYLWFGNSNMMYLSYQDCHTKVKNMIRELYQMTQNHTLNDSTILRKIIVVRGQVDQLDLLLGDAKYESKRRLSQFNKLKLNAADEQANFDIVQSFRKIVSIYYLQQHDASSEQLPLLIKQVDAFLETKE